MATITKSISFRLRPFSEVDCALEWIAEQGEPGKLTDIQRDVLGNAIEHGLIAQCDIVEENQQYVVVVDFELTSEFRQILQAMGWDWQ